ncbi:hypothetical protein MKK68_02135 [Methylobacterium sp. E-016]|uniref:hypothetical protein n=1 Tax=Methylobacterium sp. E-016 TaxID=2836556 RepID=UPI001FBBE4FF|nr:hypothetical protein [Methylobacterium sp. E-016]MCJ2074460.1 hypothetical protein [Methylobacterium sp. E-016]
MHRASTVACTRFKAFLTAVLRAFPAYAAEAGLCLDLGERKGVGDVADHEARQIGASPIISCGSELGQTARATSEISGQIAQIQASTNQAVASIGGMTGRIREINAVATAIAAAVKY